MKSLRNLIIGGLLLGATGLLYAAPDDLYGTDGTTVTTSSATKMGQLSPADMTSNADVFMNDMHQMLRHVTQLREKAQRDKDILKLNCVNDKLIPLKAEVNLADTTRHALEQAISSNDQQGSYAAYVDLTLRHDKVKDLRDQADACVGEALTYVGATTVVVSGPTNPLEPVEPGGTEVEPPTYRSPFD